MTGDYAKCVRFWDEVFSSEQGSPPKQAATGNTEFDRALKWLCQDTSSLLDFGCGNGSCLLICALLGIRKGIDEMPYVKVVITGDENGDSTVDWQDGAIAARDQEIIHIPAYSDSVRELVTTRISMNFQSEAPNPFLTALDNVKRVALHSDGLGQSVLLKGYAN